MLHYVGINGEFMPGIPASDIPEAEADRYGGIGALLATGIYVWSESEIETIIPIEEADALSEIILIPSGDDDVDGDGGDDDDGDGGDDDDGSDDDDGDGGDDE